MPLVWLVVVTFTAALQKIFSEMPRIGFLAQARVFESNIAAGKVVAAKLGEVNTLIFNNKLDAVVCAVFLVLVATILIDSIVLWIGILRGTKPVQNFETPFVQTRLSAEEI